MAVIGAERQQKPSLQPTRPTTLEVVKAVTCSGPVWSIQSILSYMWKIQSSEYSRNKRMYNINAEENSQQLQLLRLEGELFIGSASTNVSKKWKVCLEITIVK